MVDSVTVSNNLASAFQHFQCWNSNKLETARATSPDSQAKKDPPPALFGAGQRVDATVVFNSYPIGSVSFDASARKPRNIV
jgi:hypothetical protein